MPEFDEAYVKKLRDENAKWRNQVRELEAREQTNEINVELAKQGIVADPRWVSVDEGQTVADAVTAMKEQYPNLVKMQEADPELDLNFGVEPPTKTAPKPLPPSTPRTTTPKPARTTRINRTNIAEIKKDPQARAKVRDAYRSLLKRASNQGE